MCGEYAMRKIEDRICGLRQEKIVDGSEVKNDGSLVNQRFIAYDG